MSSTDSDDYRAPLGGGAILSGSFALLAKRFPHILALCLPVQIALLAVASLTLGWEVAIGLELPVEAFLSWQYGISAIASLAGATLMTILLTRLALDTELGIGRGYFGYWRIGLARLVPLMLVSVIVFVYMAIGLMFLIVPGIWVIAVYATVFPAAIYEQRSFRALPRSQALTKEFRWPIVGVLVGLIVIALLASLIPTGLQIFMMTMEDRPLAAVALITGLNMIAQTVIYTANSFAFALIYIRLRDIKEGRE